MKRSSIKSVVTAILFLSCAIGLSAQTSGKAPSPAAEKTQSTTAGSKQVLKGKTVNINKVTEEELVKNVPLVTPELAKKIVKYRQDNGDYQTLEELLQVEGFSRDLLRRIKTFLLLEGIGGKDCTC
jgi:competence protein ComEA